MTRFILFRAAGAHGPDGKAGLQSQTSSASSIVDLTFIFNVAGAVLSRE